MLTAMLPHLRKLVREDRAVAAIEFSLLMPVLLLAILAEFDIYRFSMETQRLEIVAESVAQMFASTGKSTSAQTSGDGVISDWDINFYENAAYFVYPDILNSPALQQAGGQWWQALQVDVASIKMVPKNNTYVPTVVWHGNNTSSGTTNRQCNTTFSLVSDASTSSPTTLPVDLVGPNSLIVVDVRSTFYPTFGSTWLPSISISRSVFMTPRNVPFVEYQGSQWMATTC